MGAPLGRKGRDKGNLYQCYAKTGKCSTKSVDSITSKVKFTAFFRMRIFKILVHHQVYYTIG